MRSKVLNVKQVAVQHQRVGASRATLYIRDATSFISASVLWYLVSEHTELKLNLLFLTNFQQTWKTSVTLPLSTVVVLVILLLSLGWTWLQAAGLSECWPAAASRPPPAALPAPAAEQTFTPLGGLALIIDRFLSLLCFIIYHVLNCNTDQHAAGSITVKTNLSDGDSPRGVDPDDADVAEKNALFVFLVLAGAAFLSPVGRVGELRPGALLHCGAGDGEGGGCGAQEEEEVS